MKSQNDDLTLEAGPNAHLNYLNWWLVALLIVLVCAFQGWRQYDYQCAGREAKAAGFHWNPGKEPWWTLIHQDWHNIWDKYTWAAGRSTLDLGKVSDLTPHRNLIHRLRPTELKCAITESQNVDALKGLSGLQSLRLSECPALQDLTAIKELSGLRTLYLYRCRALQDLDAIKGLTDLREFHHSSDSLQNVDALKGLTGLRKLSLYHSPALQNLDALKALTWLESLYLKWRDIPVSALRELRAALPATKIIFPDGTEHCP